MFKWILICAVVATSPITNLTADEGKRLGKAEAELATICQEMQAAFDSYYDAADAIQDEVEQKAYYKDHDPSTKYVEKLIAFERAHHASHAGLMAIRKLVHLGGGGGEKNNPCDVGRREAILGLYDYRNAPELFEITRYLDSGNFEAESERVLLRLIDAPDIHEDNKVLTQIAFAEWAFAMQNARRSCERRLKQLNEGAELRIPEEKDYIVAAVESLPTAEKLAQLDQKARSFLDVIAASDSDLRRPGVVNLDENWHLIRADHAATKSMPLTRDLASGMLFKEDHLQIGKPAPELKLQLVSGQDWTLADQRGKTVIIQFSFKGCGPCEEMYPTLSQLAEDYEGKLAILSIMADQNRDDTTNAVSSGKLKWNVCWDGAKGPITTRWAVTGFPTIYVVGPDGQIADIGLRDKQLVDKIAALTQ